MNLAGPSSGSFLAALHTLFIFTENYFAKFLLVFFPRFLLRTSTYILKINLMGTLERRAVLQCINTGRVKLVEHMLGTIQ